MTAFEEMGVMPEIGRAVEEMDWTLPTDVQAEAIPLILGGGDVLMAAETGSGKTGAFCLPILQIVWESLKAQEENKGGTSSLAIKASDKWAMNMFDRSNAFAIDPNGLLCQSRDERGWHGARANLGVQGHGKFYYEAKVTDEGLCRVGWAAPGASFELGTDRLSFGFGGTGKKVFGKQYDDYATSYGLNDVIGCCLDLDNNLIYWSKDGNIYPDGLTIPQNLHRSPIYPAVVLKNAEMLFNFGDQPFVYEMPPGFVAVNKGKGMPSPNVAPPTGDARPKTRAPYCIVIEPSRELAEQTHAQFGKFSTHMPTPPLRRVLLIGGTAAKEQMQELDAGVEIVTATPGRLEDLIGTGNLLLSNVRYLVLDEADGLLSGGYGELINRLHARIPKVGPDGRRLQMIVCSATLHQFEVKRLAERLMNFPVWIDLKGQDSVPETVHHVICSVDPRASRDWRTLQSHMQTDGVHERDHVNKNMDTPESLSEAVKIMKGELLLRAIAVHKMDRALIFCRTKLDCDHVERYMRQHKYSAVCLHSDRPPAERKQNLESFKRQQVPFLICTDVAARGIDISGLPYVIQMTLPDEKQNYVHRIGRVGRAERMGLAISFAAAVPEKVWYHSNCQNRGKGCHDTRLTDQRGCCIWYDENALLSDIEEHLGITIDMIDESIAVPTDEFEGRVIYGQKRRNAGSKYQDHTAQLSGTVKDLARLERAAQSSYIQLRYDKSLLGV